MNQFLTLTETAELLRWSPRTLQARIAKGVFKRGVHYFKRRGELHLLFDREAMVAWIKDGSGELDDGVPMARGYIMRVK